MATTTNFLGLFNRIAEQPPWLQQKLEYSSITYKPLGKHGDLNDITNPPRFSPKVREPLTKKDYQQNQILILVELDYGGL